MSPSVTARSRRLPSEFEQGGPLVGLFTGLGVLAAHHTDIAYLGACDNLFLTPDYLRLLFDSLVAEPGLAGILPVAAPGFHGVGSGQRNPYRRAWRGSAPRTDHGRFQGLQPE